MSTAIMTETKAEILPISGINFRTFRHPITKAAFTLRHFVDRNGDHVVCLICHNHAHSKDNSTERFDDVVAARESWKSWATLLTDVGYIRCEDGRN